MRKLTIYLFITVFTGFLCFLSCKKENSCQGCINGNKPPIAKAGPDEVITLPTDSALLDGSASSDPDGTISSFSWKRVSGPTSFVFLRASSLKTIVKNLTAGSYQFVLTVTDEKGLPAADTMQLTVKSGSSASQSPIAHAGSDTIITLPDNTIYLDGSKSSDPDNNISTYKWSKISGPALFSILNINSVQTQVSNLAQGRYQFELKVTDAEGLFSKDTMQVDVIAQPPFPECTPTNRPIINAQLIPVGNLSVGRDQVATASAANKIFFAGGRTSSGLSSRVDMYDIASQTWSTAELSIPRWFLSGAAAGNKVFFAGGYSVGPTSRVDIYDLTTQTLSIAELSQARAYLVTASVGNKVFFAGGTAAGGNSSRIDIYDLTTNTWSTANLSEAKKGFTATTVENKIYFAGGDLFNSGPASTKIDIYDNATGSLSTSTLNAPKAFHAAIYKEGKIFWAGGATYLNYQGGIGNEDLITCDVEMKDVNSGISSSSNLSYPKFVNLALEKDNKIVIISLYSGWQHWQDFDIYDFGTSKWSVGRVPKSISSYATLFSVNNVIYMAGGLLCDGGSSCQYVSQVWKLEF